MYVTVLSGSVDQENWSNLRHSFERLCMHPPQGLVEVELIQGMEDHCLWEVISIWEGQQAFFDATQKKLTAPCEQMFCNAGSIPTRRLYTLVTRFERV